MVDLSVCRPGDILISSLGATLKYVEKLNLNEYMDHKVKYLNANKNSSSSFGVVLKNSYGSRDNMGFVYKKNRKDSDHNIVEIRKALIIERKK